MEKNSNIVFYARTSIEISKKTSVLRQFSFGSFENRRKDNFFWDNLPDFIPLADRPVFTSMLKYMHLHDIKIIQVESLNRLSRDLNILLKFKKELIKNKWELISRIDNYCLTKMTKKEIAMFCAVEKTYKDQMKSRFKETVAYHRSLGKKMGGNSLSMHEFYLKNDELIKIIKNNPNLSYRKLANLLYQNNFKNSQNKPICIAMIAKIKNFINLTGQPLELPHISTDI